MCDASRAYVVIVMGVLTGLTATLLAGHGPWAGHVLFSVSATHGLDAGDVPVLAGWLVGALCCWRLWKRADGS